MRFSEGGNCRARVSQFQKERESVMAEPAENNGPCKDRPRREFLKGCVGVAALGILEPLEGPSGQGAVGQTRSAPKVDHPSGPEIGRAHV